MLARPLRISASLVIALLGLTIPWVGQAQELTAACRPPETPAPTASNGPGTMVAPGPVTVTDTGGNVFSVAEVATGREPSGLAVDASDSYGRLYVADQGSDQVTVVYGRSPDLTVGCRLPVGTQPVDVAVDDASGTVLVTLGGAARVVLLDGRAEPPEVLGWVELPAIPAQVVIDESHRRAWVSMPAVGQIARLEATGASASTAAGWELTGTFDAGSFPTYLALDPDRERLLVAEQGQPSGSGGDQGLGAVRVFDTTADAPSSLGPPIVASVPTGMAVDPLTGAVYVLENGSDGLLTIKLDPDGSVSGTERVRLPYGDPSENLNPVDLVFLPSSRELVVTLAALVTPTIGGHLDVFRLDQAGGATYDRSIPAPERTRGIALDPATGRVFVSAPSEGVVAAYTLDTPSKAAPPPASTAESMPGPLHISLAPEDVARTVGLSLLVLLLVGAPTPLFNETLETHVDDITGWLGRLVPRRGSRRLARLGTAARGLNASLWGMGVYLVIAALILSFLAPDFPGQDALLIFAIALFGLIVANIADILPGERYIRSRYRSRGTVRIAVWTLGLAAITVLISRVAGLQPGYMYGIIGTFTFTAALTLDDEGRMEAWGAVALLILAIGAWFARIPFEPTPGVPQTGPDLIINMGLVSIFVLAVEGLVFGLIPLRFMPGEKVFGWSRWRWLLLWGAGLVLFAHVLVYPVTLAQPSPDPSTLVATLISVGIYGLIAVLFWVAFRWHARGGGEGAEPGAGPPPSGQSPSA